ncbi:MAG: transposase [Holosporales bacterium]
MGYPSDLRDRDWELIKHNFCVGKYGNRAVHSRRSLVNAILYVVKTGCQWPMSPKDFPKWKTVYG